MLCIGTVKSLLKFSMGCKSIIYRAWYFSFIAKLMLALTKSSVHEKICESNVTSKDHRCLRSSLYRQTFFHFHITEDLPRRSGNFRLPRAVKIFQILTTFHNRITTY